MAKRRRRTQSGAVKTALIILVILLLLCLILAGFLFGDRFFAVPETTTLPPETTPEAPTVTIAATTAVTTTLPPSLVTEPLAGAWSAYLSMDMTDGTEYELEAAVTLTAQSDTELAMVFTPVAAYRHDVPVDIGLFAAGEEAVAFSEGGLMLCYDPFGNGQTCIFHLALSERPYGMLAEGDAEAANGDCTSARLSMTRQQ